MKYRFKYLLLLLCMGCALTACDSFLDRQEDENMTFEKIWQQVSTTRQYFFQVMGYLPDDSDVSSGNNNHLQLGASDEASMTWNWTQRYINFGSWNASTMPHNNFNRYYEAIRDCNIFLQNVLTCSDPQALQSDLNLWYNCARWARAYYYFLLMRDFGPVFLVGDELMDFSASTSSLARPRDTWEECVAYVVAEMEECARRLPDAHTSAYMGCPTKGASLAVISRLRLYAARDLFNGNSLYRRVVNPDGEQLFPEAYDAQKWVAAAQAAKAVIDTRQYALYRDMDVDNGTNPYANYLGITMKTWNKELIYVGGGFRSRYMAGVHTSPNFGKGGTNYGGWGPTQQQVDAYAMSNGRYPITGYESDGTPVIDETSGYSSAEFAKTTFSNPFVAYLDLGVSSQREWPQMYKDREPRFYVSVFWADSPWIAGEGNYGIVSFCQGANGHQSHDYPKPGYMVNRYYDHTLNSTAGQWGNITFPTFRLGEIYLNYIEAVLECERNGVTGEGVDRAEAMALWDELRDRSGMDPIEEVYPGASVDQLVELVRKERRVELAFEGHRYFDTRTWKIAATTDGGPMYGMDTAVPASGTTTADAFWRRTVFETRVFRSNHYLYPFPQRELDRNKLLTQNYGW